MNNLDLMRPCSRVSSGFVPHQTIWHQISMATFATQNVTSFVESHTAIMCRRLNLQLILREGIFGKKDGEFCHARRRVRLLSYIPTGDTRKWWQTIFCC